MSTLYDPQVSAACLALREDPPAALDGPILQYARDALAAATPRGASPVVWRRRTFAAIVAFIGVVGAVALWERGKEPLTPVEPPAPPIEYAAPPAPVVLVTPAKAQLEATRPAATSKPQATTTKKKRSSTTPPKTQLVTSSAAIPDEPVQVKTLSVDDPFAPQPIAPPEPAPLIESTTPSPEVCAADPLTEGCAPPSR
jgi:hypothetical protein